MNSVVNVNRWGTGFMQFDTPRRMSRIDRIVAIVSCVAAVVTMVSLALLHRCLAG